MGEKMQRKEKLIIGEIYHVFNKSIADFTIFNSDIEFIRMRNMVRYYAVKDIMPRFSRFMESKKVKEGSREHFLTLSPNAEKLVQIIAYCLMPTHIHFILKQLQENGISLFMGNLLNSYTRYFNVKHKRKGPLWEGRFKNVLVQTDEQLLHLTRYVHLNPTSAGIVNKPQDWRYSSYHEYLGLVRTEEERICKFDKVMAISAETYKKFVQERILYQKELQIIKSLVLE